MFKLLSITLDLPDGLLEEISASARTVFEVLAALGALSEHIADIFDDFIHKDGDGCIEISENFVTIMLGNHSIASTTGARSTLLASFLPSERYLKFVSAIACYSGCEIINGCHGWPILSVDDVATSTVTEAGGESILAREGGAA